MVGAECKNIAEPSTAYHGYVRRVQQQLGNEQQQQRRPYLTAHLTSSEHQLLPLPSHVTWSVTSPSRDVSMDRLWCGAGRSRDKQHHIDASSDYELATWSVAERQPANSVNHTGRTVVPEVNSDLLGMLSFTLVVRRGSCGFGFTLLGSSPVQVCRIDRGQYLSRSLDTER